MKKIAFFTPSLNIGGIERVFITYANALVNSYEVEYVVCYENGDLKDFLDEKVNCIVLNSKLPYSLLKLSNYIKINVPDYLITGGDIPNAIAILANKISFNKTKIIISQHNYLNIEQKMLFSSLIYRLFYKHAYKLVVVSDDIADFMRQFKIPEKKIVTIYNPINIQSINNLSLKSDESLSFSNYFLYVGRLSEVKNLFFLVRSFSILKRLRPDLNLLLAGDGPVKGSLESLILKLGLNQSVFLLGRVSNPYVLIRDAQFVVLPSFSEALPTIILESFALGKTIVATPSIGALDLLQNGKLGYVSKSFDDEDEFSNLMNLALSSNIDSHELKSIAYKFDITNKVNQIESIF